VELGLHQPLFRATAIFGVVVPFAADRLVIFHQQPGFAAHIAIEIFHPQFPPPSGPLVKGGQRIDEAGIGKNPRADGQSIPPLLHRLFHAPFARFGYLHTARGMPFNGAQDFAGKASRVGRIIKADVIDRPSSAAQFFGKVAHGRKDQRDLGLVMAHIGRLFGHLHHQDYGVIRPAVGKAGDIRRKLITKDRDENRTGHDLGIGAVLVGFNLPV
jgi:hypothetical protein